MSGYSSHWGSNSLRILQGFFPGWMAGRSRLTEGEVISWPHGEVSHNLHYMEVPEMGVPQIINFRFGISILNHSFWRSPIYEHPQVFWLFFSGILFHRHLQMLRTSTSTSSPTVHWSYVHDSSPVSWLQSWLDPENLRFGCEYLDPPKISPRKVWKF